MYVSTFRSTGTPYRKKGEEAFRGGVASITNALVGSLAGCLCFISNYK